MVYLIQHTFARVVSGTDFFAAGNANACEMVVTYGSPVNSRCNDGHTGTIRNSTHIYLAGERITVSSS